MADPIYTRDEILGKIAAIDALISTALAAPQQSSFGGNFVSFQGRVSELQSERARWQRELEKYDAGQGTYGTPSQAAQGPSFKVK